MKEEVGDEGWGLLRGSRALSPIALYSVVREDRLICGRRTDIMAVAIGEPAKTLVVMGRNSNFANKIIFIALKKLF